MDFQNIPEELIILFFSYGRTIIELLNFSMINKRCLKIVRYSPWPLIPIHIKPSNFETIVNNFNFSNIQINQGIEYVLQARNENFLKNIKHLELKSVSVNDLPLYPNLKTLVIKNSPVPGIYTDFSKLKYLESVSILYSGIDRGSLRTIKNCKSLNFTYCFSNVDDMINVLKLNPTCEKFVHDSGYSWNNVYSNLYPYLMNMTSITIDTLCDPIPCFPKCRKLVIDTKYITLDILKQMIDESLESITLMYTEVPTEWFEHLGKLKEVRIYTDDTNWMYQESSLMRLKDCVSFGLDCRGMTNKLLSSFKNIKKLNLQNRGGLNLQLISSTIEKLSISRYDFNCEWIKNLPHLIKLKLYNSIISNDITLLKQLHKLYFEDTAVDECDIIALRKLGVDVYGSYALDSEDCELDSLEE